MAVQAEVGGTGGHCPLRGQRHILQEVIAAVRGGEAIRRSPLGKGNAVMDVAFIVIRHGDLIYHAVDGDLHPLRGIKRLMRGDDPFAGSIACGKQAGIADLHCRDIAGQPEGSQNFGHGDGAIAGEDVLQLVIGKHHLIDGETVRLHRGGDGILRGHVQRLGGQFAGSFFLRHMVDLGFQILVGHLRESKGHVHGLPFAGLVFLARVGIDDLDVKGIGNGHGLVFVPDLLHGGIRLRLLIDRHLLHGKHRVGREYAGIGLDRDDHAVNRFALLEGDRQGLRFLSLQNK